MRSANIAASFGAASTTYRLHSCVQTLAASKLGKSLLAIKDRIPEGPVLELACGTGIFTHQIASILPERKLIVSDLSQEMVDFCRADSKIKAEFIVKDAEKIVEQGQYALIACAFAAQWFSDIIETFDKILDALLPGGLFIFSVPTSGSFPQWKEACSKSNKAYSGNALPDAISIEDYFTEKHLNSQTSTEEMTFNYVSSIQFFQALKGLGATVRVNATEAGTMPISLLPIIREWDKSESILATYEVMFGVVQK